MTRLYGRNNYNHQQGQQRDAGKEYTNYFKNNVLTLDQCNYDEFCDKVLEYARILEKSRVTTSMIRKIYDRIMRARTVMDIKRLRPQFAYIAGRNEKNHGLRDFMELLDHLAKNSQAEQQDQHLDHIQQFMEAVVAYRKYVGND